MTKKRNAKGNAEYSMTNKIKKKYVKGKKEYDVCMKM